MKNKFILGIVTLFLGAFISGSAFAATATTLVNVRSGPGTGFDVVGVLNPGDRVNVNGCRDGWCQIDMRGPNGYVSSRYLSGIGNNGWSSRNYHVRPAPVPAPQPKSSFSISIGSSHPGFWMGKGPNRHRFEHAPRFRDHCIRRHGEIYCPVN